MLADKLNRAFNLIWLQGAIIGLLWAGVLDGITFFWDGDTSWLWSSACHFVIAFILAIEYLVITRRHRNETKI